jgi:kynurenine formamidase
VASYSEFDSVANAVRNWGRWGEDDQLGCLNFITPEVIRRSGSLVKRGDVFSLGANIEANGVWGSNTFRRNPIHLMTIDGGDSVSLGEQLAGWTGKGPGETIVEEFWKSRSRFADDVIIMPLQAGTQWDALSHVWYDDLLYNGYSASSVTSLGATKNGIDVPAAKGIVGRGVLLDVARYRGVEHMEPNSVVESWELDEVCTHQGIEIETGDIVLLRTGWWPMFAKMGDGASWRAGCPGLSWRVTEWLHEHEVAALAADNVAVEANRRDVDEVNLPFHLICLRDMGLMLGEMWNLEELALDCARDRVYEMQLIAPALKVTGGVGSPVNPLALK